MSTTALERVEVRDLTFHVRPGTSDLKSINEVVARRGYARHGFVPAAGEHWLDLGSNIGAFAVWAASHDKSIRVDAYEPDPTMCELIERNARANKVHKQITVHQGAVVADRRKEVVLHCNVARGNVWRNSIERDWRGSEDIVVPTVPLKDVLALIGDNTWWKMDIEGTEMPILEHMLSHRVTWPRGMVYEWSFDVDPSLARFEAVAAGLANHYDNVTHGGYQDGYTTWQPAWFPPCRLVWAW